MRSGAEFSPRQSWEAAVCLLESDRMVFMAGFAGAHTVLGA